MPRAAGPSGCIRGSGGGDDTQHHHVLLCPVPTGWEPGVAVLGAAGRVWEILGCARGCWEFLGAAVVCWVLLGCPGRYWVLLGALGTTGCYRPPLAVTGRCWERLMGPSWVSRGSNVMLRGCRGVPREGHGVPGGAVMGGLPRGGVVGRGCGGGLQGSHGEVPGGSGGHGEVPSSAMGGSGGGLGLLGAAPARLCAGSRHHGNRAGRWPPLGGVPGAGPAPSACPSGRAQPTLLGGPGPAHGGENGRAIGRGCGWAPPPPPAPPRRFG